MAARAAPARGEVAPMTARASRRDRRSGVRRPHPVLLASRPDAPDAEASALVDLLDDALAHGTEGITVDVDGHAVALTNLTKRYFPQGGPGAQSKGDLLRYYLAVAPVILPHLAERPVVLTRYPDGAGGKGFYVQRAPEQRPSWVATCTTSIKPPKELTFLRIDGTATLAWVANLGAIELHPWYARCSAPTKPDFLVIDLDPTEGARFEKVRVAALQVKEALDAWGLPAFVKTSGATGLHLFVPIVRGPTQREVHGVARDLATAIAARHPRLFTTEYRIANRPRGTVLLDFNQNSAGHTLAGAYSARPTPSATVSTPLAWNEVLEGAVPRDFTLVTVPMRLSQREDPWARAELERARVDLAVWREGMVGGRRRAS
jgi:bifunctional non-homologous end joining protein LigD